jgi:hypothetical protein
MQWSFVGMKYPGLSYHVDGYSVNIRGKQSEVYT